jgi:hypothetical protein
MVKRLQKINGDTVLEITEDVPVKTRLSVNTLLRQKEYFEASIREFQARLADVNASLIQIHEEADKQ